MKTIHKFPLSSAWGTKVLHMPRGAEILCVQVQNDWPTLWALVDPSAEKEPRMVCVVGTGEEMPAAMGRSEYVGTVQEGVFVWHIFADAV